MAAVRVHGNFAVAHPVPALSAHADEAITEQGKGAGGRNAHDLGLDEQLNARVAYGLRADDWMEKS